MRDYFKERMIEEARERERTANYDEAFCSMTRNERRSLKGKLALAEAKNKDLIRRLNEIESEGNE